MPSKTEQESTSLESIRHSLAHLLASAMLELFPEVKLGIGPTIEDGFYYDFKLPRPLTPADLPELERTMRRLIKQNLAFEGKPVSIEEARKLFRDQPFKLELINDLATKGITAFDELQPGGETRQSLREVSLYRTGNFIDLCRGGHVNSTNQIPSDAFKLVNIAGAYWRGSVKNPMLQRVYGVAFGIKAELEEHLKRQAEMKKRDHRRLGINLELFRFEPVSPGSPIWLPNGMIIFKELEKLWRTEHEAAGYHEVSTPILYEKSLWERSGHWQHYQESMFTLKLEEQTFVLKPMNCPASTFVYRAKTRSYRDLPLRLSEIGRLFRNEVHGALGGMFRVRQLTMDDAHIYCRPDQIAAEITGVLSLIKKFYRLFKFTPTFSLSTMPEEHLGEARTWEQAERSLEWALKKNRLAYTVKPKEGAFYGPKVDVETKDNLGRSWQLATIQLDFQLPERFELSYVDKDGKLKRPVIIHRAIFGSFERFIGILTEHFAGAFPLWLSPVQVQVIPVGSRHVRFSQKLGKELREAGVRVVVDDANETVGYKVRKAEKVKVPYLLVIGDKEMKSPKLHVKERGKKEIKVVAKNAFVTKVRKAIDARQ